MAESDDRQAPERAAGDATAPADGADALERYAQQLAARIHDGPLQDLVAASLTLAVMRRTGYASLEEITEVSRLLDAAITQLRAICAGSDERKIRPDLFTELRDLCAAFEADSDIVCQAKLSSEHLAMPADVADVVYRAVRELLTNVRKHAQAGRVEISSSLRRNGDVAIEVVDDGIGLTDDTGRWAVAAERDVFGLWSIKQRLQPFGGSLELVSDSGLRATLVIPRVLGPHDD